jgi:hypothetical protein
LANPVTGYVIVGNWVAGYTIFGNPFAGYARVLLKLATMEIVIQ